MGLRQKLFKHGNIEIQEFDFSHSTHAEAGLLLEDYIRMIEGAKEHSIYLLINATGAPYDHRFVQRFKSNLPLVEKKVIRSALYGVPPLLKMSVLGYRALARLLGQNVETRNLVCDNREQALDWLQGAKISE